MSILRVGETVSVTLAFCTVPRSNCTQCGHGGGIDIIVTRPVIKLRGQNGLGPRDSSRNHPVSQMHACHRWHSKNAKMQNNGVK